MGKSEPSNLALPVPVPGPVSMVSRVLPKRFAMYSAPCRQKTANRSTYAIRPRLECLEDRVVLSTFRVNTTLDTVAVNLNNGKDAAGHVSLRSAIMAADAKGGKNTIVLPSGVF